MDNHCLALPFQTASENTSVFWNPWVQLFVCETCTLIVCLSEFFTAPPPDVVEQLPTELCTEWQEFFSEGIKNLLLPLLVKIPGEALAVFILTSVNANRICLLLYVVSSIVYCRVALKSNLVESETHLRLVSLSDSNKSLLLKLLN